MAVSKQEWSSQEKHAWLSASGAHRWSKCVASVFAKSERTTNAYAERGNDEHKTAARMFESLEYVFSQEIPDLVGVYLEDRGCFVTQEMQEIASGYVAKVTEYAANLSGQLYVETPFDVSSVTGEEGAFATPDVAFFAEHQGIRELQVHDLKTGQGELISAFDNTQLMVYAAAILRELTQDAEGVSSILLVIHQPRRDNLSEWRLTREQLEAKIASITEQAQAALMFRDLGADFSGLPKEYLVPGEHCKYCPARGFCSARVEVVEDLIGAPLEEVSKGEFLKTLSREGAELSPERMAVYLRVLPFVKQWLKDAEDYVNHKALREGVPIPGWKVVEGRLGNREWSDETEAEAVMKSMKLREDVMYSRKLISPTQAEKVLKDQPKRLSRISKLWTRPDGKLSLAPAHDPRAAVAIANVADDFAGLSNSDFNEVSDV